MGKIQKKGVKGAAANFITRQRALNKLQISLADFRRLCILKGIYPRDPKNKKKANKGSTAPATFYYIKDIQYLLHEPLLQKFRQYKAFAKKLNRVLHKGEYSSAKSLEEHNKPVYTLDHIVKERYPTFVDALRDLDDALSMLFLFSKMPADRKIKAKSVADCQKLIAEFEAYVIKAKCLRKVFFSIKGIYYQAEIKGQTITWIVPYQFSQAVPTDVDFRVMLTFLDFYITLTGFVNYHLYNEINIVYPPNLGELYSQLDASALAVTKTEEGQEENSALLDEFKSVGSEEKETITLRQIHDASHEISNLQNLFAKCVFFISRETPRYALEFMIRSCGGRVSWDVSVGENPPYSESDEKITHQLCDRPTVSNRVLSRAYIQPQWIADCINARQLLKTATYEPGQVLPPHLSPFVESRPGDYVPDYAIDNGAEEDEPMKEEEEEEEEEKDLKMETEEEKEMKVVMMTNKQRKLYQKMQHGIEKKKTEVNKLQKKKAALQTKQKQ